MRSRRSILQGGAALVLAGLPFGSSIGQDALRSAKAGSEGVATRSSSSGDGVTISLFAGDLRDFEAVAAWERHFGPVRSVTINAESSTDWNRTTASVTSWIVPKFMSRSDLVPIVGLPLLPYGTPVRNGARWDLRLGAEHWGDEPGWLYKLFQPILSSLLQLPHDHIDVRLGWEQNVPSQAWNAKAAETEYAAYWRNLVAYARSLDGGERFRWHWCPAITAWPCCDTFKTYPGDDVVDVIGFDLYDREVADPAQDTPEARWDLSFNGAKSGNNFGLGQLAAFAREHGKRMIGHEVGAGEKGDNPYFARELVTFAANAEVDLYWWNHDTGGYNARLTEGQLPKTARVLRTATS
ncbi:glycosyl hydrolase [Devosia sp. CN2-171]|uniref:glycosyl hydrolase n=1 Tax=Devosia sp. CN2-171 TaxID=3400909 RepID=UPI003BF913CB